MQYRTRARVAFVVGLILVIDLVTFVSGRQVAERAAYENRISELEAMVETSAQELETTQEDYRRKLEKIVQIVYEREFYNMGGYSATEQGADVTEIYEAIVNEVRDYREMLASVDAYFDARREYLRDIPSIWPVEYNASTRITSGYGWRLSPVTLDISFHSGLDIAGEDKTVILAPADGKVIEHWLVPGWHYGKRYSGHEDFGGMIKIEHAGGFETLFGHLGKSFVHEGQDVKRGEPIGEMGNTGASMGIHLHYQMRRYGRLVNPIDFIQF